MDTLSDEDLAMTRMITIMAWMFFPRDEGKRQGFEDAYLGEAARAAIDEGLHKSMNAASAAEMIELARPAWAFDLLKAEAHRVIRRNGTKAAPRSRPVLAGSLAANALLMPLICNLKYGRNDIGRHHAFRAMLGTDEKDDPKGLRNLQKIWQHYEPVSHLWAAWHMFDYPSMDDLDDFTAIVSLSELIRTWGAQYKPRKADRPLLSGAWVVKVPAEWVRPLKFDLLLNDVDLAPELKALLLGLSDG